MIFQVCFANPLRTKETHNCFFYGRKMTLVQLTYHVHISKAIMNFLHTIFPGLLWIKRLDRYVQCAQSTFYSHEETKPNQSQRQFSFYYNRSNAPIYSKSLSGSRMRICSSSTFYVSTFSLYTIDTTDAVLRRLWSDEERL